MEENKEILEAAETEEKENTEMTEENTDAAEAPAPENEDGEKAEETDDDDEELSPEDKAGILKDTIEIIESTLITVFVVILVFTYLLHPVNIVGRSMVPTLNNNYSGERQDKNDTDKIFMSTVFFNVKYGDILVIDKDKNYLIDNNGEAYEPSNQPPINECIIKRVIACGGQTIDIQDGQVIVDGEVLNEPYIADDSTNQDLGAFTEQYPFTIPEGYYFVMGDNRDHSTDSRQACVGLVKKDQIYGKAVVKYHPLSEFSILINSWKG